MSETAAVLLGDRDQPSLSRTVLVLCRLRMLIIRRRATSTSLAPLFWIGAVGGLAAALATGAVALLRPDLLTLALTCWMLGAILAAQLNGGTGSPVSRRFLALSALTPARSALAATITAPVGIGPVAVLLAGLSQLALAEIRRPLTILIALIAALLWATMVLAIAQTAGELSRRAAGSTAGALISGAVTASVFACTAQSWAIVTAFAHLDSFSGLVDPSWQLPTSWGASAIGAADEGRWTEVLALLSLLLLLIAVLISVAVALAAVGGTEPPTTVPVHQELRAHSPRATAFAKAIRCLVRDRDQLSRITFAVAYGVLFTTIPLAVDWRVLLPYAGPIIVVMAGAMLGNTYGAEGTSVWLIVSTPGAARLDVRSRQLAQTVLVGGCALGLVTLLSLTVDGYPWPLAMALLASSLGAAAGWSVLIGVLLPTPAAGPRRHVQPRTSADTTGGIFLILAASSITAAPGFLALWIGWWAVPIGTATGLTAAWILGQLAWHEIDRRGPELLARLGATTPSGGRTDGNAAAGSSATGRLTALSPAQRILVLNSLWICPILVVQQGILPGALGSQLATGPFLAMLLPTPWSWLVMAVSIALGLAIACWAAVLLCRTP